MSQETADSSLILHERMNRRSGGDGQSPHRASPVFSKKAIDWMPIENHPIFTNRTKNAIAAASGTTPPSSNVLQNLLAWGATSSHLFLWDAESKCVHRLAVRFRDPDPVSSSSSSSSVVIEAAFPSEILLTDIVIQATVHHISLNINGSALLLFGSEGLNVMYLLKGTHTVADKISCRTVLLGSKLFSSHSNGLRILQASWHPNSESHICVLSSDSVLRLFDLSFDLEQPEQEFYLQPENGKNKNIVSFCPIAFSFGENHLWERFSVFILYSNGSLYVLCPIVPFGSLYNWMHIMEIYEDAHVCGLDLKDSRVSRNSVLATTWIEATFPMLVDKKIEGDNVIALRAHSYVPVDASLALQGPLVYSSNGEKDEIYVSSTHYEGKPVNFLYSSIGKDSVFIIAWSSGLLQIDALADEVQPLWKAGSSPQLHVDTSGNIKSVAVICQSVLGEVSTNHRKQLEHELENIQGVSADVSYSHLPPLLKLAIVDLALPKDASNGCLIALFPDPLQSERFYSLHSSGMDIITLHCLPFSNVIPEKEVAQVFVRPILLASHFESSPPVLCGYITMMDSYGHSHFVGVTPSYDCLVMELHSWNDEMLPFHFDMDVKPADSTETLIPEILSKELLSGPKAIIIPPTSLRSLTPDSIEGRSTLHHYNKLFLENYVEYAHKVYFELKHHGDYLKTVMDNQQKYLKKIEQSLSNAEKNEKGVVDRINRAFKIYELLDKRLDNFKALPAENKKPLSRAEREFNSDLDRIANLELDSFESSIYALNTRLKRYLQSSPISVSKMARVAPGRRKGYVPNDQVLKLKSSLGLLSNLNSENTKKVKLIEKGLKGQQK